MEGIHPFDAGTILDKLGIAIRTGHHCAQPIMDRYNISGTMRASFALYNTKEEIDTFIEALDKVKKYLLRCQLIKYKTRLLKSLVSLTIGCRNMII